MFDATIRRTPRPQEAARMTADEFREAFLLHDILNLGKIHGCFTDLDRLLIGGAVPVTPLELGNHKETGHSFFLEARELGVLNVGGPGTVHADGESFHLDRLDVAYIGRGTRHLVFESRDSAHAARFVFLSCPAHAALPSAMMKCGDAVAVTLGEAALANRRTIRKFIHTDGLKSCQLVLGFTELAEGSVWNTFPPHTHNRRTEIYFYFDLGDRILAHFAGTPHATRHVFIRNEQAALSPAWSIHAGCGFGSYRFLWAMAGENQAFDDMDAVRFADLR
jgi:4-deoxy-L-threo-5-hexosulose-uronate ketol-isomerase